MMEKKHSKQMTDRGFESADAVIARKAHRGEDGDALLGRQVVQWRRPHGAVTGRGKRIHH